MACNAWREKIDAYADGELSAEEMRGMGEHLRGCPACTADVLGRVQMKRSVQSAGKRFAPSLALRQRIEKGLPAKKSRHWLWSWMTALTATCALLVIIFLASVRAPSSQQARTFAELADVHVSTLASASPVDVVSTDRHTVKPWFQGKIPFTFNLPELGGTPFTLEGGRMAYLDQAPGAQLIFKVGNHRISVFIFQDRSDRRFAPGETRSRNLTFNIETWVGDNLRYFVVGDADPNDIHELSGLLKAAAGS
jgi:anti-sigma factor RsiW